MRNFLILTFLFLVNVSLSAQFAGSIRTGRPGQAIGPYVLGQGVYQLQTGLEQYFQEEHMKDTTVNTLLHNTVLRIGFSEKFELNMLMNWQIDKSKGPVITRKGGGVSDAQVGLRFNVLERKGAFPGIGFQYRLLLPWQTEDYRREYMGSAMTMATHNKFFDKLNFVTNFTAKWGGNVSKPSYSYAISNSFDIGPRLGGFVELYGGMVDWTMNYDGGFSYLLNDDTQLDLFGGWQEESFFFSAGVSWRVVRKEKR